MRTGRLYLLAAIVVALLARSGRAVAHPAGISQGEYVYRDDKVFAGVTLARRELAQALPWLRSDVDAESPLAFELRRNELGKWLLERLLFSVRGEPCTGTFDGMRFEGDGVALALSYVCPARLSRIDLEARFVLELARGHRHIAVLSLGDQRREAVATPSQTLMVFDLAAPENAAGSSDGPPGSATRRSSIPLLRMGIEHILTGYDHLLFLLGLVLIGGPIRSLVAAVTAFTVAHSITLGMAAFGVWAPSPSIVEPCIALSIAYVGVENWFIRDARGRWRVTLPFGLLHGFGFAGALREVALPRSEIPTALLAFNVGVELGQVAVLAAMVPMVFAVRKRATWDRVGMRACTMTIALAGVVWFIARVRGSV